MALSVTSESASGENGYKVSWSSIYDNGNSAGERPFNAFNGDIGNTGVAWMVGSGVYRSDGTYAYNPPRNLGTATGSSTTVNGEYIILQTPNKIKVKHFRISDRSTNTDRAAEAGKLYGSNDGSTWYELASFSGLTYFDGDYYNTVQVNAATYYDRLALVVTNSTATSSTTFMGIGELEYYGVPEYDPEAHGVDVVVKSVANVPNTDWLEVYYDAKNYTNGAVQDLSTNSFNGTLTNGASFNNSDGIDKFVFDAGLNQYMTTTTDISGVDFTHTTSMWVKFVEVSTDSNDQHYLFMLGAFGSNSIGMYYSANQGIRVAPTGFDYRSQYHPVAGRWFHVSYTYAGGAHGTAAMNTTVKFYINGKQWNIPAYHGNTSTVTLPSSSVLQINGSAGNNNTLMDMEVGNFRLFNRVLTTDEIYQLYAYQKEDFGHGDLSMTLKAGRLGIGTSEPMAALDVRGDIFGRGIIQVQSTTFNGITSGNSNSFTTLPGLTTKITPKRPGSKILVLLNLFWSGPTDAYFQGNVKKDGTVLVKQEGSVGSASKTSFASYNYDRAIYCLGNIGFSYLDDSNIGTQPIEYTVEVRNRYSGSQYWYINYTSNTADANRLTGVSTLTLLEIQQ